VGRPRIAALAAIRAQAVRDDEPTPVDADTDAETVGDTDGRVRGVVAERLGEP
jgi:hypothetical protein